MSEPGKQLAPWLLRHYENKNTRRGIKYYVHRFHATPPWADRRKIAAIEREAKRKRKAGKDVEVDHIVPLMSPYVCGLHCEANLQIIPRLENAKKSNHQWPDMWSEQQTLFDNIDQTEQYELWTASLSGA